MSTRVNRRLAVGWAVVVKTVIIPRGDTRWIPEKFCGAEGVTTVGDGMKCVSRGHWPRLFTAWRKLAPTRKAGCPEAGNMQSFLLSTM